MGFLDDIFDGEDVFGGLFDLNGDGKVSIEEALFADELFLKDHSKPNPCISVPDDLELEAKELGLDPDAYDLEEDLMAAIEEERGW